MPKQKGSGVSLGQSRTCSFLVPSVSSSMFPTGQMMQNGYMPMQMNPMQFPMQMQGPPLMPMPGPMQMQFPPFGQMAPNGVMFGHGGQQQSQYTIMPPNPPDPRILDRGDSLCIPPYQPFPDDDKKLSTAYKSIGLSWKWGEKRVATKKFRCRLCAGCNSSEFAMLKVSQIDDEYVDILVYCLARVLPSSKICDLGCTTKGDARQAVRTQYMLKLRKNRSRLDVLAEEFDNLPMVGLRLGYPP